MDLKSTFVLKHHLRGAIKKSSMTHFTQSEELHLRVFDLTLLRPSQGWEKKKQKNDNVVFLTFGVCAFEISKSDLMTHLTLLEDIQTSH